MYLLYKFLQPTFKEICVDITTTDEPITQLEVRAIIECLSELETASTDRLQKIKNRTKVSPFEGLDNTSGSIM